MSANPSPRIVRFSTFELNLHSGELRQRGQKVKLQEQPLQVLTTLLEQPGELITREQLRNKLWPADTFVDFDHSLNTAIRRLRDALGETAERPIFVETVARRGYRFIGHVEIGAATPSPQPRWRPATKNVVLGALVEGLALLALAIWRMQPTESLPPDPAVFEDEDQPETKVEGNQSFAVWLELISWIAAAPSTSRP